MLVVILDPDESYAIRLKRIIQLAFPDVACVHLTEWENNLKDSEEPEEMIVIYTEEFYPGVEITSAHIILHEDPSYFDNEVKTEEGSPRLYRLASVRAIIDALSEYCINDTQLANKQQIYSFLFYSWSNDVKESLMRLIEEKHLLGDKVLLLELGANYHFVVREVDNSIQEKNYLLSLSLNKVHEQNFGNYLEPWPLNSLALRLVVPPRSDDWILSPTSYIRETIELYTSWAKVNYQDKWVLCILCVDIPFQLLRVVCAYSNHFQYLMPEPLYNEDFFMKEFEKCVALLPRSARSINLNHVNTLMEVDYHANYESL